MQESQLQLLSNSAYVTALARKDVQAFAAQLGIKTYGKTQDIALMVKEEAERRLNAPEEPLDEWSMVQPAEGQEAAAEVQHNSLRSRLQRSASRLASSLSSSRSSSRSLASSKSRMSVDEPMSTEGAGVRLVSHGLRSMASNSSLMQDLVSTDPTFVLPPVSLPSNELLSPSAALQSPAIEPSAADFAAVWAKITPETATSAPVASSSAFVPSKAGNSKAQKQAALGVRGDQRFAGHHAAEFNKMQPITAHPSVRRHTGSRMKGLAADEMPPPVPPLAGNKRVASTSSIQSITEPAAKRLRQVSAALTQPTSKDAALIGGLLEEGFAGMPKSPEEKALAKKQADAALLSQKQRERQDKRQQERLAQRQIKRDSPAKRAADKVTKSLLAFGGPAPVAKPLPPLPLTNFAAQPAFGTATAARAVSHTARTVSGASRIPVVQSRVPSGASVGGSAFKPTIGRLVNDENDAASLRSVSGSTIRTKPRVERSAVQARVASKTDAHMSPLRQLVSPLQKRSASPGKTRSSIQQKS